MRNLRIVQRSLLPLLTISTLISLAQQKQDSTKLPFAIADEKRLSDEDIRNKKEGTHFTFIPDISSDPVNGFGYGGEGSVYFNGKRNDPFFNYTAYRTKIDFVIFNTTNNQREFFVKLDVPYILNTKWRLRVEGGFETNPNLLYFGLTPEQSLPGLQYYPNNDSSQAPITNARYNDYEKNALVGENEFYHTYTKKEAVINISMERSFFGDKMSSLIGFELAQLDYSTFKGNSLLQNDYQAGLVKGVKNNFITIAQGSLAELAPYTTSNQRLHINNVFGALEDLETNMGALQLRLNEIETQAYYLSGAEAYPILAAVSVARNSSYYWDANIELWNNTVNDPSNHIALPRVNGKISWGGVAKADVAGAVVMAISQLVFAGIPVVGWGYFAAAVVGGAVVGSGLMAVVYVISNSTSSNTGLLVGDRLRILEP